MMRSSRVKIELAALRGGAGCKWGVVRGSRGKGEGWGVCRGRASISTEASWPTRVQGVKKNLIVVTVVVFPGGLRLGEVGRKGPGGDCGVD